MDEQQLVNTLEALVFAAGEPLSLREMKAICGRAWRDDDPAVIEERVAMIPTAKDMLLERWRASGDAHGFELLEVAGGLTFRSHPRYADAIRAIRENKPKRWSKAALETLAIVAYRQPATKPEIDHIRGVDCGGILRMLLERAMVRIVGKREEPGRPLLYGTTSEFLSFFNLTHLNELPSLREYHELNHEAEAELEAFDGAVSLESLSGSAKALRLDEEPAVAALDQAVHDLDERESDAVDAFAARGCGIGTVGDG